MRLSDGFITHDTDGEHIMVATGHTQFAGIARSNKTAAFIVELLKHDTTKEKIVDAMLAKYDAPRVQIETDVDRILDSLRDIGALDE